MKEKEGSLIVLNRSVVIGIIVLVTTISFTFGYFAGRYSSKKESLQTPQKVETTQPVQKGQDLGGTNLQEAQTSGDQSKGQSISEKTVTPETKQQGIGGESNISGQPGTSPVKTEPQPTQKATPHPEKEVAFKKGAYYLQVGAFRKEESAKKMREDFKKEPYDVIIKKEKELYRVYVGSFKTKKEALLAQTRLRKIYKIEPLIIKK